MISEKLFIVAVREHNYLGHILNAYFIDKKEPKEFFTEIESVKGENEKNLNLHQREIVRLISQFSDSEILRVFSKKKKISIQDFFTGIEKAFFEERIQPYLESRIKKILDIIISHQIPLYYKSATNIHKDDKIVTHAESSQAVFNFIKDNNHTKYFLSIIQNHKEKSLLHASFLVLVNQPAYVILNNTLFFFSDIDSKKLLPFFSKEYISISQSAEAAYYEKFVLQSLKHYQVRANGFEILKLEQSPELKLQLNTIISGQYGLIPTLHYGEKSFYAKDKAEKLVWMEKTENNYRFFVLERNSNEENLLINHLKELGLQEISDNNFALSKLQNGQNPEELNYELLNWLSNNEKNILSRKIRLVKSVFHKRYYTSEIKLHFETKKENDWFDIYANVLIDGIEIPFIKFKKNLLQGIREYQLPDGRIVILPKAWFEKYGVLLEVSKEIMGHLRIEKHHSLLINHIEEIDQNYFQSLQRIYNKKPQTIEKPAPLQATLRQYQQEGFSWLAMLMEENLGACLADDMGLGKTLQTLALIEYLSIKSKNASAPNTGAEQLSIFEEKQDALNFQSLIIMPTSLLYNWQNEINRFLPGKKVLLYSGFEREQKWSRISKYDIILSSYGVVRNDYEKLEKYKFNLIILDESQNIKNPGSKIYQAIETLNAQHKIVLTGTPIENSLSDLWAQMNFINPGLLGTLNYFKEKFLQPIEKKRDEAAINKFKKLVNPFILRRTKREVAGDLPELTEQLRYIELSEEHLEIYNREKSKIRNFIMEGEQESDFWRKSKIQIFQSISKLRQLANHAALVFPEKEVESEKFNEIFRILDEIILENNKVLVFSSYIKILSIFEHYLKKTNQSYALLTGAMKKEERQQNIDKFQNNEEILVFLLSIKAGGVGLNLTAADYVLIVDPWWNPAVESQAINRAHRIGQKNNILVYRFISKETIEQKIQILQNKKRNLSQDVLTLEKDLQLNNDELKALFE